MISSPAANLEAQSPAATAPLTLFAIPKAFSGHIGMIQRNAIRSWTLLRPRPEILLFANDPGTGEVAREFGLRHVPEVARSESGRPLMDDMFRKAHQTAAPGALCYVNCDIVLLDDFMQAFQRVAAQQQRFLMVGRRMDLEVREPLAFESADWAAQLRSRAAQAGKLNIARSIDYFLYSRGLFAEIPPFAIGRFWWDNWLIWKARSLGAAVIDATQVVLAIHQNHEYEAQGKKSMLTSPEARRNCELGCEGHPEDFRDGLYWRYFFTIDDASHRLTASGIRPSRYHEWKMVKRTLANPGSLLRLLGRKLGQPRG